MAKPTVKEEKQAYQTYPAGKTIEQWEAELDPGYFSIWANVNRRLPGNESLLNTQIRGTGVLDNFYPDSGHFACTACSLPVYAAQHKFAHPCGWSAFNAHLPDAVGVTPDANDVMNYPADKEPRDEIYCRGCGGHLGHRFYNVEPWRDCVNSICLTYVNTTGEEAVADICTDKEEKLQKELQSQQEGLARFQMLGLWK